MSVNRKSENYIAALNICSTVITAGISFFTIPLFTRMLSTDGYGIVSIYEAWVQIIVIFIGLKADGSISSAYANLPAREHDSYQYSVLVMSFLSFTFVLLGGCIFSGNLTQATGLSPVLLILAVIQSFGVFIVQFFNMRYIFSKEAKRNFMLSVGISVSTTILSVALICTLGSQSYGAVGRALGLTIPNLLLGIALFVSLRIRCKPAFRFTYWKFCLALSLPLIFHGLSQQLLSQSGKLAVQQYCGDSAAGVFGLAVTISSLVTYIYTALNNAFVPFMYDDLAGKNDNSVKCRHFTNYFSLFTLGSIAFAMMSPEVLKVMSTEAYWGALQVLPILVIGKYCVFLYSFPVNFEFYKMRTKSIALGTILAGVLNVVLCAALVPEFGMMGAAVSSMLAYICLFFFHFCIARFFLGDRNYPAWMYFAGLGSVIVASFAYYPLSDFPLLRWAIGFGALCVAVGRVIETKTIF